MARRQFPAIPLGNEVEEPALRARCITFHVKPVGTGRRVEKHGKRFPGFSRAVAATLKEFQFLLKEHQHFAPCVGHKHPRESLIAYPPRIVNQAVDIEAAKTTDIIRPLTKADATFVIRSSQQGGQGFNQKCWLNRRVDPGALPIRSVTGEAAGNRGDLTSSISEEWT